MSADPFFEKQKDLFAMMLQNGVKLEQECIVGRAACIEKKELAAE